MHSPGTRRLLMLVQVLVNDCFTLAVRSVCLFSCIHPLSACVRLPIYLYTNVALFLSPSMQRYLRRNKRGTCSTCRIVTRVRVDRDKCERACFSLMSVSAKFSTFTHILLCKAVRTYVCVCTHYRAFLSFLLVDGYLRAHRYM